MLQDQAIVLLRQSLESRDHEAAEGRPAFRVRREAINWLKKAPFDGGAELEVRPFFEAEDFGKEFTPELRAQEDRLRQEIDSKSKP